jgi:hypothetical protein
MEMRRLSSGGANFGDDITDFQGVLVLSSEASDDE